MDSHEFAVKLEKVAEYLKGKPAFKVPDHEPLGLESLEYFWDKDGFVSAVRALGSGRKEIASDKVRFYPADGVALNLHVQAERNAVCKLVRPAEYDCEPLLSAAEEASMSVVGGAVEPLSGIPF